MNPQAQALQHMISSAAQMVGTEKIPAGCKKINTYYSRYDGSKYHFSDGGTATFVGGIYQIDAENPDNAQRIKELEYIVDASQPVFSRRQVRVVRTDSKLLREVGHAGGGTDPDDHGPLLVPSVGMVNSLNIAPLAKQNG